MHLEWGCIEWLPWDKLLNNGKTCPQTCGSESRPLSFVFHVCGWLRKWLVLRKREYLWVSEIYSNYNIDVTTNATDKRNFFSWVGTLIHIILNDEPKEAEEFTRSYDAIRFWHLIGMKWVQFLSIHIIEKYAMFFWWHKSPYLKKPATYHAKFTCA